MPAAEKSSSVSIEVWVREYSDLLFGFVVSRVADTELAKDLLQETFLTAWKNRDNYRQELSVKNWLFLILRSRIIDHYRKQASRAPQEQWDGADEYFDGNEHWRKETYPAAVVVDPREQADMQDLSRIVAGCGKKLKSNHYAVFRMKYVDGMSSEEICSEIGISNANFWVMIHRAKLQLRACLEKNWLKQ